MNTAPARRLLVVGLAVLIALGPAAACPSLGQGPLPPGAPTPAAPGAEPGEPQMTPLRAPWCAGFGPRPGASAGPPAGAAAAGRYKGPDAFGYTWDDTVALNWVDALSGTVLTALPSGLIDIGFPFRFYERTYTQLYVSAHGFVSFQGSYLFRAQSEIPDQDQPNDIIAPYWAAMSLAASGTANRVYYRRGSDADGAYLVVEWYQVQSEDEVFTFELVLRPSGDILFQYLDMLYPGTSYRTCSAGIEDWRGSDGLACVPLGFRATSNIAVLYRRPAFGPRGSITPRFQGDLMAPGQLHPFRSHIRNVGDLGADTFDLAAPPGWPVRYCAADGTTPLADTDGDGTVDTGELAVGEGITVTAWVRSPCSAVVGDHNSAVLTVRSSLDASITRTATLQTAIPAPFSLVLEDDVDWAGSLYQAHPGGQATRKVTPDSYNPNGFTVVDTATGPACFWTKQRYNGKANVGEIEFALFDQLGRMLGPIRRVVDESAATSGISASAPDVAVAPDGHIGVLWERSLGASAAPNENVFLAILDQSGALSSGPFDMTGNLASGAWDALDVPFYFDLSIAATADSRFVLAWRQRVMEATGLVDNIYLAVRDSAGEAVGGTTQLTFDTAEQDVAQVDPEVIGLADGGAFVGWARWDGASSLSPQGTIWYQVVDSGGNPRTGPATLVPVDDSVPWGIDAAQLANGNIAVGWTALTPPSYNGRIRYAVLDSGCRLVAGPSALENPAAATALQGEGAVSVAADGAGHAILTWTQMNFQSQHVYYALLESDGALLTPAQVMRSGRDANHSVWSSYEGNGNSSYHSVDPPMGVGAWVLAPGLVRAPVGGAAEVRVRYGDDRPAVGASLTLTATLGDGLGYSGDTSGATPTLSGGEAVWSLPEVDAEVFTLTLQVAVIGGARLPLSLTVASTGPEEDPSDNTAAVEVLVPYVSILPLVLRGP